ncbi:hypothetical protein PG997_009950 [Apiospora hydei]|uniref:Uncharacterized protein n=1 Tax=Apiospora hydei TaxID=1337664 RepID=A0ABR1VVN8_9PEZI
MRRYRKTIASFNGLPGSGIHRSKNKSGCAEKPVVRVGRGAARLHRRGDDSLSTTLGADLEDGHAVDEVAVHHVADGVGGAGKVGEPSVRDVLCRVQEDAQEVHGSVGVGVGEALAHHQVALAVDAGDERVLDVRVEEEAGDSAVSVDAVLSVVRAALGLKDSGCQSSSFHLLHGSLVLARLAPDEQPHRIAIIVRTYQDSSGSGSNDRRLRDSGGYSHGLGLRDRRSPARVHAGRDRCGSLRGDGGGGGGGGSSGDGRRTHAVASAGAGVLLVARTGVGRIDRDSHVDGRVRRSGFSGYNGGREGISISSALTNHGRCNRSRGRGGQRDEGGLSVSICVRRYKEMSLPELAYCSRRGRVTAATATTRNSNSLERGCRGSGEAGRQRDRCGHQRRADLIAAIRGHLITCVGSACLVGLGLDAAAQEQERNESECLVHGERSVW